MFENGPPPPCVPRWVMQCRGRRVFLFYRWRRGLRGGALLGVICDKNVMFLFVFCSTKIVVCNNITQDYEQYSSKRF